jgi:hypothetical protein
VIIKMIHRHDGLILTLRNFRMTGQQQSWSNNSCKTNARPTISERQVQLPVQALKTTNGVDLTTQMTQTEMKWEKEVDLVSVR